MDTAAFATWLGGQGEGQSAKGETHVNPQKVRAEGNARRRIGSISTEFDIRANLLTRVAADAKSVGAPAPTREGNA